MKCPTCGREMKSRVRDYDYVESGLKNVVLKGITVHECKHCGEVLPEISNVKQIHKWIAEYLVRKQGPLTGDEFRFLRKALGKNAREIAERIAVNPVSISRWECNKVPIGAQSDRLFRMIFILGLPEEARMFTESKCLEIARAVLQRRTTTAARKPRSQRIEITPRRSEAEDRRAHE